MFSYSYYPIVTHPTRITDTSATCIDHIWTNIRDRQITSGIFTDEIADHLPVFQMTNLGSIPEKEDTRSFLSPRDLEKLTTILSEIDINRAIHNTSIDESVHIITNYIFQSVNSIEKTRKTNKNVINGMTNHYIS